jgi:hypothetical protein
MRKFKYVGNQKQADGFWINIPVIGKIYNEDDVISERTVLFYAECRNKSFAREWEEIFESVIKFKYVGTQEQANPYSYPICCNWKDI